MNGYDIYKKAATRAGIVLTDTLSDAITNKAEEFINQIAVDLKLAQISSLWDEIECDSDFTEALCCGVTMLLTLSISDIEKNTSYTNIYNAKRAAVLSKTDKVKDIMPAPSYGGE